MDLHQNSFSSKGSLITECVLFDETPLVFFDNHRVYRVLGNDIQLIQSFTSLNLIINHCLILPHCILLFSECSSIYYFPHTAITTFTQSQLALSSTSGHSYLLPVYSLSYHVLTQDCQCLHGPSGNPGTVFLMFFLSPAAFL